VVHVHVAQAFFPEVVWVTSRVRGRRPYVAHFHLDVGRSGSAGRLLPFYKRHVLGRVLRDAAVVIALSDAQAEFLVARYGCAQERVVVVPNAVPPGLPDDSGEVIGRYDGTRALRLLFVGRVSIQKNLPLLLEAVHAMTRPAELVVAGGGDDLPAVKELATQLGMTGVNFTDQLERSELSKWYRWADAFVITSEREGMPLAVLEAMSFGLPVIGTEVDGLRSLLAGIGELVEARPSAVARVLDELAADPARLEKLATLSQEHATTVGWGDTVARIEEIYAQISASRSTL
jgi:phosphatidylinositol alpha-mannosyltransferase